MTIDTGHDAACDASDDGISYTTIPVMYRDAANYKRMGDLVAQGAITPAQRSRLTVALDDRRYYCPEQLGLDHLGVGAWPSFPCSDDHGWHEMMVDSATVCDRNPILGQQVGDIEKFVRCVEQTSELGWAPVDPEAEYYAPPSRRSEVDRNAAPDNGSRWTAGPPPAAAQRPCCGSVTPPTPHEPACRRRAPRTSDGHRLGPR
ncbi:hypothetical protein [Gordonia alkanivorans]|uniref:hypothetical protein n=1 Tax=Gordonia alkanivorans TaxID=84096 RepID=UPI0012DE1461|nr:hypothetical protein [Gordonia alkanivorans]